MEMAVKCIFNRLNTHIVCATVIGVENCYRVMTHVTVWSVDVGIEFYKLSSRFFF